MHSDTVKAINRRSASILVTMDLYAAFDVIDHQLLFSELEYTFGITSNSLHWIESYVCNWRQGVKIREITSAEKCVKFGVRRLM